MRSLLFAILCIAGSAQAQTLVYSCLDSGADGRILEGDSVGWPNCQTADYRVPTKTLVVGTNSGTHPFLWKLASNVTTERIWSSTDGTSDWRLVSAITWGTTPVPPVTGIGSVTLTWTPPTQNTDGTPLTDLAGYRVVYGPAATALNQTVQIVGAGTRIYLLDKLAEGKWYFAVKAYTTGGAESDLSNVVSKTISGTSPAPVDCSVSAWSAFVVGPWSACANGQRSHTDVRTRVVVTPASNGGAACPALTDSQTISEPCSVSLRTAESIAYRLNSGNANKSTYQRVGTFPAPVACTAAAYTDLAGLVRNVISDRNKVVLDTAGGSRPLQVYAVCKLQ